MWGKLRTKVVVDHEAENPYDMSGESEEKVKSSATISHQRSFLPSVHPSFLAGTIVAHY